MLTLNVNDLESGTQTEKSTNNVRTMIETAQPSAALEDYIEEIRLKQRQTIQQTNESNDDREQDLILAAELGKALLERNEQLTLANESITEQYSQKLEQLEQEKHSLRRKLELLQDDYESKVLDLKNDIANYRKRLTDQQDNARQMEKSEGKLIQELIEQNERLTNQLKQSSEQEELLSNQIISLREQFSARRSNFSDHVSQIEGLKTEINLLNRRKTDLEKRINLLNIEREQLQLSLEESNQKCFQLEQRCTHHAAEVSRVQRELDLQRQLCASQHYTTPPTQRRNRDQISPPSSCSSVNGQPTSLFNELMSCDSDGDLNNKGQNSHLDKNGNQILDITMLTEETDEIECDMMEEECDWKLKSELLAMYQSMRTVCAELNRRKEDRNSLGPFSAQDSGVSESSSPSPISESQLSFSLLQKLRKEFKAAFSDFFADYDEDGPCRSCKQLLSERNETMKLRKDNQTQTDELKRTRDQLSKLQSQLTIMETELAAAKEEKQMQEETANVSGLGKEEIVKRAFELRDQAVKRKNQVEIELAKTRIECMHINSQLMEAIQQKVELSQQLEQWQVDMQSLLNEQLKNKLSSEEQEAKLRKAQMKNSSNNSPSLATGKTSLTANLITSTTGTLNRNKFLRLFISSKSTNQTNKTPTNDKTANGTVNSIKSSINSNKSSTNSNKSTKTGLVRTKSINSTTSKIISTISGNTNKTAVSVSS